MNKKFYLDSNQYYELCTTINKLIEEELNSVNDAESTYPKLVIMYEFFRLLRGEAFTDYREPLGENQKDLYKMEDELFRMIKDIKVNKLKDLQKAKHFYGQLVSTGLRLEDNVTQDDQNPVVNSIRNFMLQDHKRLSTEDTIKLRKEWINEIKYLNSFLIFIEQQGENSRDFFSATQFTSPGLQNILEKDSAEIDPKSELHKLLADFLFKKTDPRRISAIFRSTGIDGLYIAYGKTEQEPFLYGYIKVNTVR